MCVQELEFETSARLITFILMRSEMRNNKFWAPEKIVDLSSTALALIAKRQGVKFTCGRFLKDKQWQNQGFFQSAVIMS